MSARLLLDRRSVLLALLASGCSGGTPARTSFPPLDFSYLTPLRLNVAGIDDAPLPPPGPLDAIDPVPPGPALQQMASQRLFAAGSLGRALFTVERADLVRDRDALSGVMAVRLDVMTSEGKPSAFARAQVSRQSEGIGSDLRAALYDITAQMMTDMNVEFEFQVRQSLRDWLQATETAPPPPAVEAQPLAAPGSRPAP